ncbi:MAG TPA: hypothetical protein VEU08_07385, partial [Vicinamibacterales bacterium]|nr:hypothetical protein [Vicinamibacterales bacterium]
MSCRRDEATRRGPARLPSERLLPFAARTGAIAAREKDPPETDVDVSIARIDREGATVQLVRVV